MKSILLTAILASVGFAFQPMVQTYTNQATPFDLGLDTKLGFVQAYYDVTLGVGLENNLEQGDQEGVMDAWIQASTWAYADFYVSINLLNLYILNLKFDLFPLHIVPLWASFYYTHPSAVMNGIIDEFGVALDFGYEINLGEFHLFYYFNELVPKVSLSDLVLAGSTSASYPSLPAANYNTNIAGVSGWDWNIPNTPQQNAFFEEPFFAFNLLDYLNDEGTIDLAT